MNIWVTSDQHFQHKNILKYCSESRPFSSVEEMNNILINNWNSVVQPDDIVYVLGDICMGAAEDSPKYIKRLNGKIILVIGNHDTDKKIEYYKQCSNVIDVIPYEILFHKGTFYVMNHFPVEDDYKNQHLKERYHWQDCMDFFQENKDNCIWLYGHVHDNAPQGIVNNQLHVGVDTNNLTPVLLDDIVSMI